MADPTVCAVMLTRDRPEYARRAVAAFRAQTYLNKWLLVWDTGDPAWFDEFRGSNQMQQWTPQGASGATIPALRNTANMSAGKRDIFAHWDDDDYSHPNRIAEQVALLQASGAECVGYREMLFWRERERNAIPDPNQPSAHVHIEYPGEAWLYSNPDPTYCLGTSLCYWRSVWERRPFPERNGPNPRTRGEDREWLREVKSVGYSFLVLASDEAGNVTSPRMIARIHAGNAQHYSAAMMAASNSWRRVPQWDEHCRKVME